MLPGLAVHGRGSRATGASDLSAEASILGVCRIRDRAWRYEIAVLRVGTDAEACRQHCSVNNDSCPDRIASLAFQR